MTQSFDFSTFSASESFNDFQRNFHIFFWIRTDHINTSTVAPSYFTDLTLKKHQMFEKYLFSDVKAENGLFFEDVSSCFRPTSWVNDNIISYFFVYLQKFNTNVVSLPTFFYNDYIDKKGCNSHYLQFTISDLLSKDVVFIPTNINENHWMLFVILPLARTVMLIDSLSYKNNSALYFTLFVF